MKINKEELDKYLDKYIDKTIKDNTIKKVNNLYLSTRQISVLEKYNINYKDILDINELIFRVEDYINGSYAYEELYDLEDLSRELSEFNYYYNTDK